MRPRPAPIAARMASSRERAAQPREQQVGDVAARDQQHQPHRRQQDEQPQPVVADENVLSRSTPALRSRFMSG